MSVLRNLSRILGNKNARSIFDKLGRGRSQPELDPYRIKGKNDIGYTAPSVEQENAGASTVNNSLPSKSYDRRLAGYTKPENSRFETIDSSYTPYALRPKQFRGLPNQMFTRGTMFADGTVSSKANLANQGVRRFNNEKFVGDQSYDLRDFDETNVPPPPSSLVQPFAQPVQQSANQIFGDLFARQNAVGAPMMFKINK